MGLLDLARRLLRVPAEATTGLREPAARPDRAAQHPWDPQRAAHAQPPAAPQAAPADPQPPNLPAACLFFSYATGRACGTGQALNPAERAVLEELERLLQEPQRLSSWIPRPPAVLPRLLACLREDDSSLREACAVLQEDPYLATEVLRLANSARHQHGNPVTDLKRAAVRLGFDGLRRAISSSLVRPLFDVRREPMLAQALPRLWTHAQSKSGWCHAIAPVRGVDAFDAYLAGLTHNIGWIGALKAVGRASIGSTPEYSGEFVLALTRRSERMFACSAEQWAVNDALSRLGATLRACSLEDAGDALAQVLYQADARATAELAAA